ncbi:hypothetical protein BN946_scf184455.g6 [Trametes cinnabarina]|uniref:SWIM-type domain-containing protein n=1 Tax=Pycnoporus cinnabarinus TaxID=5643 RepID=A0A060SSA2_PYCCI|nr:hypothetical protein BN946_scf184455.g6 [Trametes cinnabarina]
MPRKSDRKVSRLKEIPDTQPVVAQRYGSSRLKDGGRPGSVAATSTTASLVEPSQRARRSVDPQAAVRTTPMFGPHSQTAPPTTLIDASAAVRSAEARLDNSVSGTHPPATAMNPDVEDYWYALTHVGGVFRLDREQFVFQEWDSKEGLVRCDSYVHVMRLPRGPDLYGTSCTCPQWKSANACLHQDVIRVYITELEALPALAPFPLPEAVFLQATPFRDAYVYSCVSSGGRFESGKRVIVSYQRDGRWHCQSCRYSSTCKHVPHALEHAQLSGLLAGADDGAVLLDGTDRVDELEGPLLATVAGCDERRQGSISHQTIPVPRWCSLPHEASRSIPPPSPALSHFCLDALSRCSCGLLVQALNTTGEDISPSIVCATLYGFSHASQVSIEVVPCPTCQHHRRCIGPDLGSTGVFNWNNRILFTHELLNAYTNTFTASETPFSAFCLTVRRQYEDQDPKMKFCSDETFVRAWFAFVQLQDFGNTMICPTCGPSPTIIIADGVTLATHASQLTTKVRPPTLTDTKSEVVSTISSYKARGLAAITQKDVRTLVIKFVESVAAGPLADMSSVPDISSMAQMYPALSNF